ncbi:elongation factor 1-alpha, putative [Entamoeba invadens IP1]|uniref:Elongation factor 1-alpha, putative n=1 Tax=Entamoeba invadens IP1 TaxID=370355 RepID=A0A0A1U7X7_ENTIV|nr:elongation factor 1-alpha, putative [Entamoeba invadens IP1]ELP89175.1 elongation factor 1-alpha, putative [Entamoeba invadens IP1]|eukprot:XP_004255946.1 elongation factor 1-alpha, putative [Entamoeba invadens IP1]
MSQPRQYINLVVGGHFKSGKSTLMAHFLYEVGGIDKRSMEKAEREAQEIGMVDTKYSRLLDYTINERNADKTINTKTWKIITRRFDISMTDIPGCKKLKKNAIRGIQQADIGTFVVSAVKHEFEFFLNETKELLIYYKTFLIDNILICVNKMSCVEYSEEIFNNVKSTMTQFLKSLHFDLQKVTFIPTDGFEGDNLIEKSPNMGWFNEKTYLDELDSLKFCRKICEKPLRIVVEKVSSIIGIGTICSCVIESGVLVKKQMLRIAPSGATTTCESIERHHEDLSLAKERDYVGIRTQYLKYNEYHIGDILSDPNNHPAIRCGSFEAKIVMMFDQRITERYDPVLNIHMKQINCYIKVNSVFNRQEDVTTNEQEVVLKKGETAMVTITPLKKLCVEKFTDYPKLGTFVIRDSNKTVAVGVVTDVTPYSKVRSY